MTQESDLSAAVASRRAVLKFGGEVVQDSAALRAVLEQVCELRTRGWSFVLVHGGGPQAAALQRRLGLTTEKVAGERVTDRATLEVMKQCLAGSVSLDVVSACLCAGLDAIGLSGVSGKLVTARRRAPRVVSDRATPIDYGWVGDVEGVRVDMLEQMLASGWVPVVNPLAFAVDAAAGDPCIYNVNADVVAADLAIALGVERSFLVTEVGGVLKDIDRPESRIARLDAREVHDAIASGVVAGGMIPKVREALRQLAHGVTTVHILGASKGALLAEVEAPGSCGTILVPEVVSSR